MAVIGDKLRSAREAKGLSIADIEKATKIQGRYLTAIENEEFDKLPGDFYVRAFIRQYAQIVGLDGKKLLNEFHEDVPEPEVDQYAEDSIENKSEEVRETTKNKKVLWKNYLPRIVIGLGIIAVVLVAYALYAHFAARPANNAGSNTANDNVRVSSNKDATSKKKAKKQVKRSSIKMVALANDQYEILGLKNKRNLVVQVGPQNTTVTIYVNGQTKFAQTLTAGQKHTMVIPTDARNMIITLSNDSGSKITIGSKKLPYEAHSAYRSLTLYIGKKPKQTQSTTGQTGNTTGSSTSGQTTSQSQSTQTTTGKSQSKNNSQQNSQKQNSQTSQETNKNNSQSNQSGNSNSSSNSSTSQSSNNSDNSDNK